MRKTVSWRFLNILALLAVLLLSVHFLFNRTGVTLPPPKPSPLPEDEYRLLSPQTYGFLLQQPDACEPRNPFLVLAVPVPPAEVAARDAIRKTWGSAAPDTLTLFFMGATEGGELQEALEAESRAHGDLIQMDFAESYQNLTIKTLMIMSWLAVHCPNATFAMKVDADIFVNIFYLLARLRDAPRRGYITGSVISDGRPRREHRSKWRLSVEAYPQDRFPPYLSGAGYVFSMDLAARISWASRFVRFIPLEDVYVGLCLRVLGVHPVYSRSLLPPRNLFEIRSLEYDRCTFAKRVLVNGFEPSRLLGVWWDFSSGYQSCIRA